MKIKHCKQKGTVTKGSIIVKGSSKPRCQHWGSQTRGSVPPDLLLQSRQSGLAWEPEAEAEDQEWRGLLKSYQPAPGTHFLQQSHTS